jgi:hypothetical protein
MTQTAEDELAEHVHISTRNGVGDPTAAAAVVLRDTRQNCPNTQRDLQQSYEEDSRNSGDRVKIAHILSRVKEIAKRQLFHRMKTYKMAVSPAKLQENWVQDKFVRQFFQQNLPEVHMTENVWKSIQKQTTKALRARRSSANEAVKKLFTGRWWPQFSSAVTDPIFLPGKERSS